MSHHTRVHYTTCRHALYTEHCACCYCCVEWTPLMTNSCAHMLVTAQTQRVLQPANFEHVTPTCSTNEGKQHVSHTSRNCESERQTVQVRIAQVACCIQFSTAEFPNGVDYPTELQSHKFGAHKPQSCSPGLGSHTKSADEFKQTSFVDAKLSSHNL